MTDTSSIPESQIIADVATRAADPKILIDGALATVVVPAGGSLQTIDLEKAQEKYRPNPRRARGTVTFTTGASLEAYVNKHNEDDATALYADVEALQVAAVINGHQRRPEQPGWGDHRAVLKLRTTPEWKLWTGGDGKLVAQTTFAEHIEQGLADIVSPPAAEMLEMAQTFQSSSSVQFKSHQLLANGQRQLQYEETITAKAGEKGNLTIPPSFTIGIAPFDGAELYRLTARIRFRVRDGVLAIGYQLERPDLVLRTAFNDVVVSLEEATGMDVYHGTAANPLSANGAE